MGIEPTSCCIAGTVARTKRIPIEQRAEAAVIAWMRHQITGYDDMKIARVKGERREVRRMLAQRSKELLAQYRRGETREELCPLERALSASGSGKDQGESRDLLWLLTLWGLVLAIGAAAIFSLMTSTSPRKAHSKGSNSDRSESTEGSMGNPRESSGHTGHELRLKSGEKTETRSSTPSITIEGEAFPIVAFKTKLTTHQAICNVRSESGKSQALLAISFDGKNWAWEHYAAMGDVFIDDSGVWYHVVRETNAALADSAIWNRADRAKRKLDTSSPIPKRSAFTAGKIIYCEGDLVQISLGSKDGLVADQVLEVYRLTEKGTYLGKIKLVEVFADSATGTVLLRRRDMIISKPGDNVSTNLRFD